MAGSRHSSPRAGHTGRTSLSPLGLAAMCLFHREEHEGAHGEDEEVRFLRRVEPWACNWVVLAKLHEVGLNLI